MKTEHTGDETECENGHKMTGVGFDDCCPECEAPWISTLFIEEKVDSMVRDFTQVSPRSKSEVKGRILRLLSQDREQLAREVERVRIGYQEGVGYGSLPLEDAFNSALDKCLALIRNNKK